MNQTIRIIKEQLQTSSDDLSKVKYLNDLARAYMYRDLDLVNHYANEALSLALVLNNNYETVRAYISIAARYVTKQELALALEYYHKAYEILEFDPLSEVRICMGISNISRSIDNFRTAKEYSERALELSIAHKLLHEEIACYNNFGKIYSSLNMHDLAQDFYNKAITLCERENAPLMRGFSFVSKVKHLFVTQQVESIEDELLTLEALIDNNNELWYVGIIQCLWGMFYANHDIPDYAKERFELGISILEDEVQLTNLVEAYIDYSNILIDMNRLLQAESIYKRALAYLEAQGILHIPPILLKSIGHLYKVGGNAKESLDYFNKYEASKSTLEALLQNYF